MYHVLVFQKGGRYHLDSDGETTEEPIVFDTLDELVTFLIGHDLKVNGEEIHLQEFVRCDDDPNQRVRLSSNGMNFFELPCFVSN